MYPKAYRWVAEMEEVSDFAGDNAAAKDMYAAIAQFYEHMARDFEAEAEGRCGAQGVRGQEREELARERSGMHLPFAL